MAFRNFHLTKLYNQRTHRWIRGYLQNIAMTPIKFRFKAVDSDQLRAKDEVNTGIMKYRVILVRPYGTRTSEAILGNNNLI